MCRRFIPIDCDEVARIAAEIERDLAAHADELASLDPIEAYEDFLFFPESAQPDSMDTASAADTNNPANFFFITVLLFLIYVFSNTRH